MSWCIGQAVQELGTLGTRKLAIPDGRGCIIISRQNTLSGALRILLRSASVSALTSRVETRCQGKGPALECAMAHALSRFSSFPVLQCVYLTHAKLGEFCSRAYSRPPVPTPPRAITFSARSADTCTADHAQDFFPVLYPPCIHSERGAPRARAREAPSWEVRLPLACLQLGHSFRR